MNAADNREVRVAVVIPRYFPIFGGAENQCRLLVRYLKDSHGVAFPFILTKRIRDDLDSQEWVDGVAVHRLGGPGMSRWSVYDYYWKTFRFLLSRRQEYDLIHCHATALIGFIMALLGRLAQKPVVLKLSANGEFFPSATANQRFAQRLKAPLAHFTASTSHIVALNEEGLSELRRVEAAHAHVIPNGVDSTVFCPPNDDERHRLRARHGFGASDRVFIFSGRFVRLKGIDTLLAAFLRVLETRPDDGLHLCLAGSADLQLEAVGDLIEGYLEKSNGRIKVLPAGGVIADYLKMADTFVFPSRNEGLPNAVLEALAVGLPCVLSDIEPHVELATRNPEAEIHLFPTGDIGALARVIERQLDSLSMRAEGSRASGLNEEFLIHRCAERYDRLYRAITNP